MEALQHAVSRLTLTRPDGYMIKRATNLGIPPRVIVKIGLLRALANRNYRIYACGNTVSMVGTWVQRVAIGWLTWELTHSTMWLGIIAFAELLPTLLVGLFAGAIADRANRLLLFRISQVLAMSQSAVLWFLTFSGLITADLLLIFTLYLGFIYGFAQPVRLSLIPSLVRPNDLHAAISCNSLFFNIARVIGPIIAGAVIIKWDISHAFGINVMTYFVLLWASTFLTIEGPKRIERGSYGMISGIGDGIKYAIAHPAIRPMLILFAITATFGRPFAELLPGMVADILNKGALELAWLTSSTGAGAIIAGVFLSQQRHTNGLQKLVVINTLVFGLSLVLMVASRWFWIAVPCTMLAGFSMVVCAVGVQSIIQAEVANEFRGRALSLYGFIFRAGVGLGSLTLGALASSFGLPWPIRMAALLCVIAAIIAWRRLQPPTHLLKATPN
ncbi:MAG: MFS transporter [Pseudomonadota bacterium]|nr:MFS transporter [Pseudomonadota bacterium]